MPQLKNFKLELALTVRKGDFIALSKYDIPLEYEIYSAAMSENKQSIRIQYFLPEGEEIKSNINRIVTVNWDGEKHKILVSDFFYPTTLLFVKRKEQ